MKRNVLGVVAALGVLAVTGGSLQAASLLAPGDFIIAVDTDLVDSGSDYPGDPSRPTGNEQPFRILDGNTGTKYLNFGRTWTGFIVTPAAGSSQIQSFTLTTANDAPERDPSSWRLYGTNDAISSVDNSNGFGGEIWSLVDFGSVDLPCCDPVDRQAVGPIVSVNNPNSYSSYMLTFPTVRGPGGNSMQVADAAFYTGANATGSQVLAIGDPIWAVQRHYNSRYPGDGYETGNETPALLLDGDKETKYLNFGEENSGFIVTPQVGSSVVRSFRIKTANDHEERDPASWILYGTDDPIESYDNGIGNNESWTVIDSGTLDLTVDPRQLNSDHILVNNNTAYSSYRMLFPTVRDATTANSMQISDVQFYNTIPEPSTIALAALAVLGFCGVCYRRKG